MNTNKPIAQMTRQEAELEYERIANFRSHSTADLQRMTDCINHLRNDFVDALRTGRTVRGIGRDRYEGLA